MVTPNGKWMSVSAVSSIEFKPREWGLTRNCLATLLEFQGRIPKVAFIG
jgi:hypothetical protein